MTVQSTEAKDRHWQDVLAWGLILGAYLLHYLYALFHHYLKIFPASDSEFYWNWSLNILLGKFGLPFTGLPGYAFFVAGTRLLFPTPELQVLLNHLLMACAGGFLYLVLRKVVGRTWALLGGILFLLYTPFMMYASIITPEPLGLFLLGLALVISFNTFGKQVGLVKGFLFGLLVGFLLIVRPAFLFWAGVLGLYCGLTRLVRWRWVLGYYLGLLIIPALVVFANWRADGLLGFSTHAGINFFLGNGPGAVGTFRTDLPFRPTQKGLLEDARIVASKLSGRALTPGESARFWIDRTWSHIFQHPWWWLRLELRKLGLLFNYREYHDANWESMHIPVLPFLDFGFIFPWAILALWTTRKDKELGVLRLLLVLVALSIILVFVNTRYKMMLVYPAIALAVMGLRDFVKTVRARAIGPALAYALVVLGLFALGRVEWVKTRPSNVAIRFNRAMELMESGDLDSAKEILLSILKDQPKDYLSWFALGNIYYSKGDVTSAMACFWKSHRLNRLFADAVFNVGVCAMDMEDWALAERCFTQLYEVSPQKKDVLFNLIFVLAKEGKCDSAQALMNKVDSFEDVAEEDVEELKEAIKECKRGT